MAAKAKARGGHTVAAAARASGCRLYVMRACVVMNNMIKAGSSAPPSRWVVIVVVIVIESLRVVVGVRVVVECD